MGIMKYDSWWYWAYHGIATYVPRIKWPFHEPAISESDRKQIAQLLSEGYYIIATANKFHLSHWLVCLLTFLQTWSWPKYSHVLMNVDNSADPEQFMFMEATYIGVHYSSFEEILDCTNICLLSPKHLTNQDYTDVLYKLMSYNGKEYDDLFRLVDDRKLSCVELVRNALMAHSWYAEKFSEFEKMIEDEGNLNPQMFRDCSDFKVMLEK